MKMAIVHGIAIALCIAGSGGALTFLLYLAWYGHNTDLARVRAVAEWGLPCQ